MSPRENATEVVNLRLRPSFKTVIDELADAMGLATSEFIRLATEEKVRREKRKMKRERAKAS